MGAVVLAIWATAITKGRHSLEAAMNVEGADGREGTILRPSRRHVLKTGALLTLGGASLAAARGVSSRPADATEAPTRASRSLSTPSRSWSTSRILCGTPLAARTRPGGIATRA